jgi:hypothetical protein
MNISACYLLLVVQKPSGLLSGDCCSRWVGPGRAMFSSPTNSFHNPSIQGGTYPFIFFTDMRAHISTAHMAASRCGRADPGFLPVFPYKTSTPATYHRPLICPAPANRSGRRERERGSPKTLTPPIPPPEIGILRCRRRHGSDERPGEDVLLRARVQ